MKIHRLKNIFALLMFISMPAVIVQGMDMDFENDFNGPIFLGSQYCDALCNGAQRFASSSYSLIRSLASKPQTQNVANACAYAISNPAGAIIDIGMLGLSFAKKEAKKQKVQVETLVKTQVDAGTAIVNDVVEKKVIKPAKKYAAIGAGTVCCAVALYYTAKFISKKIEENRRIPNLAYKSSEKSFSDKLYTLVGQSNPLAMLEVILSLDNQVKFNQIVKMIKFVSSQAVSISSINFRNLLLVGPSGTGKSMFTHNLAITSGMDYYMFKAADLLNEQGDHATHALQALISWAETKTAKGKLIFIDDADLLFAKKDLTAIRNFLDYARLGSARSMLIFSTNKSELDTSLDRCAEDVIIFSLPNMHDRIAIIDHYINAYMLHDGILPEYRDSVLAVLQQDKIAQIASVTEGFSGEDLKNYIKTIVSFTSSNSVVVTHEIVDEALQQAIVKHAQFAKNNA